MKCIQAHCLHSGGQIGMSRGGEGVGVLPRATFFLFQLGQRTGVKLHHS